MPLQLYKISSTELTASASTVTFNNIPSGYTDLKVVLSLRATGSRDTDALVVSFNSDTTAANYLARWFRGNGSAVTVGDGGGYAGVYIGEFNGGTSTASSFTSTEVYIPNYTSANKKSISVDIAEEANQTLAYIHGIAGLWSGTAAVTTITFTDHNGNNFAIGSTATLYGIL